MLTTICSFGQEFIKVICCFSTFNEDDVLKFGFELFDEDSSGTMCVASIYYSVHIIYRL